MRHCVWPRKPSIVLTEHKATHFLGTPWGLGVCINIIEFF